MHTSTILSRGNRAAELILGIVLFARAAVAGALANWLVIRAPGWDDIFLGISTYAFVDGTLALLTAALFGISRYRGGPVALVVTTLVDAAVRLSLGWVILAYPGIIQVPMTVVPLFGVVGGTAAVLGGVGILAWAIAHDRRLREHSVAYEALFDPIPVIAIVSIVIGARLVMDPPATATQLRPLVAAGAIGVAIGFAIAGAGSLLEAFRAINGWRTDANAPRAGSR